MWSKLFKREKARVYLDSLVVTSAYKGKSPKFDLFGSSVELENLIREKLTAFISLPHMSTIDEPRKSDLALEMVVLKYNWGGLLMADINTVTLPLINRPKVHLKARLYNIASGKTVAAYEAKEKLPWKPFFSHSLPEFSLKGVFGNGAEEASREAQMFEELLYSACLKILQKMRDAI
ncbi:hypothetical protein HCH_06485 [Hahella chejuensis KCTC 2396]|uniref:Uncharacterized protein n=1 Tax=Hahella chejuensis (strain KCTC 2396) TaxID=349521 RepID=Q2S898_HAHCH|nr:hypothetical protein [Hahella chejuensis]ABC33126.1 hypothetical protein HCH_06485 [Hahella chejuensis KCTC 2396]